MAQLDKDLAELIVLELAEQYNVTPTEVERAISGASSIAHLPWKFRIGIAAATSAAGFAFSYFYLKHGLKKIKRQNDIELEIIDNARKIVMVKAEQGDYINAEGGFDGATFLNDYDFYKIAEREKRSK